MSVQPTRLMKLRLNVVVALVLSAFVVWIMINLVQASVLQSGKYQAMANDRQFKSVTIKANRGSIYDANNTMLAQSATVFTICIDPSALKKIEDDSERERQRTLLIDGLVDILGADREDVTDRTTWENYQQVNIKSKVEKPVADKVLEYADENKLKSGLIFTQTDTKRYYLQGSLAASVIGFTQFDGQGAYGIEKQYDAYLSGTDGKIISARDANGAEMPYKYEKVYEAQNGNNLYLTLDMTLQYYVEKYLQQAVETHSVNNRACAVMMNVNTGEIYAMATYPGFDLNTPSTLTSPAAIAALSQLEEGTDEYNELYAKEREKQWKNKAISELYYPGSVFKVITGSAALEEKTVGLESTFVCNRVHTVLGIDYHCWANYAHGVQNFTDAMTNSCNPAFIQIGATLGPEKFSRYFASYGFTEKTGIDLPGEAQSFYVDPDRMTLVDLASSSFGQTNKITPMQMITAYAAVVNGGYLVTPYVVSRVEDESGNVIKTAEKSVKRQVISEETSATMRQVLFDVVRKKGGSNAYIQGYKIGGKSGTSQKLDELHPDGTYDYVSSYCAFAPADNPEVILLVMCDSPKGSQYYGSQVSAPAVASILEEALPYLGFYPEYTDEELQEMDVTVPDVSSRTVESAKTTLESLGLNVSISGSGSEIYAQVPDTGSAIPRGGTVILYTDEDYEEEYTTVPDLVGRTLSEVNILCAEAGVNVNLGARASHREDAKVALQNYTSGARVAKGTVIQVMFVTDSDG